MINFALIQELRKNKKWSYETLSKKIECPIEIIKLWESGELTPTYKDLVKLSFIYNIDVKKFYLDQEEKSINILIIIILFIIGCSLGVLIGNIIYLLIIPTINILLYLFIHYLNLHKHGAGDYPKSLFGFNIASDEIKVYLYESNIIAIIYTYLSIILRVLNIQFLVPHINIIKEKNVNTLLIIILSYLLLMILSFIIELVFGLKIKKEYKE